MIQGVFAPAVSVMRADQPDQLDGPATRRHIERIIAGGVHGLAPGGTGGEFIALSLAQRQHLVEIALEAAEGAATASHPRIPVYAGTGAYSTRETIQLSLAAKAAGADGLMLIQPYFMAPSEQDSVAHFRAVKQAVDLPIMVYQNELSGVKFSLDTLVMLAEEGTLSAAKISQRDPSLARDFKLAIGDKCAVFVGHDAGAFEALCAGVDGWISGIPIVFPALARRLFDLVQVGDWLAARHLWSKLTPFVRAEFGPFAPEMAGTHTISVIKAALQILGDPVGDPILPLHPVRGVALDYLRALVLEIQQLVTDGAADGNAESHAVEKAQVTYTAKSNGRQTPAAPANAQAHAQAAS